MTLAQAQRIIQQQKEQLRKYAGLEDKYKRLHMEYTRLKGETANSKTVQGKYMVYFYFYNLTFFHKISFIE